MGRSTHFSVGSAPRDLSHYRYDRKSSRWCPTRSETRAPSGWPVLLLVCTCTLLTSFASSTRAQERPSLSLTIVEDAPSIDGVIAPGEWPDPVLDEPLTQFEPEKGEPSPFRTTIHVAQTQSALYVAFAAHTPDGARVAAAQTTRDGAGEANALGGPLDEDDSVAVLLDTFSDRRSAYLFQVNALATQLDGRITDNGRTVDLAWDAAWKSAARRFADRYVVEIEIPLVSLRFQPGEDRQWGVSFLRTVPDRLETSVWPAPAENRYRVSNFGVLEGLDLEQTSGKKWQLIPYALGVVDEDGEGDVEVGGDFRFQPSSSLGLELTINPDFALIEADVEVINLSRFELRIPEKRTFFLEGSETYEQRIQQFNSRRIGDITWGAKAIGTLGKTSYSALVTSEDRQSEDPESGTERADYGVLRVQRSLPRGSSLGLLAASRKLEGEQQGSVGLDTTLFFTDTLGLTAQLTQVHGIAGDGGLAWFVRPAYDSRTTHFHIGYTNLDDGIRRDINAIGFLRDDDRREWDTRYRRTFWLESGAVEKVQAIADYERYSSQEGVLRGWEAQAQVELVFRNQWELELEYTDGFELFEKEFRNERVEASVGWDSRRGQSIFGTVGTGTNFDSDLTLFGLEADWRVNDRFGFSYEVTRLELDPDPEGETTWIHILESSYFFNPDNFIKLFAQTNDAIDKVNVQALWVWRFLPPFGSIQVAYQTGTSERGEVSDQGDTLFAKLSWVF